MFPYVKITKVTPFISKIFGNTNEPKKMVINVIAKDQSDIKKIVKPFYWKYPMFKWVSFKELRGLPKQEFANELRSGAITIIVDEDASFCYSAIEAMKSGSIVMLKVPRTELDWAKGEDDQLPNCCVWFDDYDTLHKQIASVVRTYITDRVPTILAEEAKKVYEPLTRDNTRNELVGFVKGILDKRMNDMKELITQVKEKDKNNEAKKEEK